MMRFRAITTISIAAVLLGFFSYWVAQQSFSWFPPEAADEARLVDNLFSIFVGLGTFIFIGVLIPIGYSLIFHRAGKYDLSDGAHIEGNTALEIIWTAVPVILVAGLVTASYQTYTRMNIRGPMEIAHIHVPQLIEPAYAIADNEEAALKKVLPLESIEVTAKQWAWIFHYPERDITSTELHVPIDRRIHLTLRSQDVLHGFYIPAFRVKQDVVPNRAIEFEFSPTRIGTYRLRDSMFSGTYFAANQSNVVVQSRADYDNWLADAAAREPTPAYNQAIAEYKRGQANGGRTKDKTVVKGWETIPPGEAPVVNYAPEDASTPIGNQKG